jgi:hypothetical protein
MATLLGAVWVAYAMFMAYANRSAQMAADLDAPAVIRGS